VLDVTVRDGFASAAEVAAALAAWPASGWHAYGDHKRASVPGAALPGPLASLIHRMAQFPLPGLIPDLSLWGAGLHEMPTGSTGLGWHTDAERHPALGLGRARSGVLYLCGDGDLEFRTGARVSPAPGRLVIFDGSEPHRVGPVTADRRSVALFWYHGPRESGTTRAAFEEAP
jgi:hypothetical protein